MPRENPVEWGFLVYTEMFVAGVAAGAYAMAAMLEVLGRGRSPIARTAHLIAFPLMAIAGVLLILDLNRPERFWHMLVQSKTFLPMFKWWSPMSVGSWLILIFPMFLFISFVDALIAMRRLTVGPWSYRQTLHGSPLGLAWSIVGGFIAFAVTAYSGTLLTATSFPGWKDSTVIGALFVATGLVTGVAAVQMVQALRGRTEEEDALRLERASTWLLVWWLAVLAVFLVLGLLSGAARAFLSGPSLVAIVGAILIGGIAPLVLQRLETRRTRPRLTAVWAALILVGGYLLRYAVVMGPQHG